MRRCVALRARDRAMRAQVEQFASLEGWQKGQDPKFDAFVARKRMEAGFEEFDQRVERAYTKSLKDHKTEIWNAVKRRLKTKNEKYTPDVLREANQQIEERTEWLREVFGQIDADYRSDDPERQAAAARDLSKALGGEPFEYMAHAYDAKRDRRLAGPKGKMLQDAEADPNLPNITDEEANRYHALRPRMTQVEAAVKAKYGIAGVRHWDALQAEKDAEYEGKLATAAEKYQELLDQATAYDSSVRTTASRTLMGRMHEGQVRFQTAMEIEEERLKLVEAREQMDKERFEAARERHRDNLRRAADLRTRGRSEKEIQTMLKEESLKRVVERHDLRAKLEQDTVLSKKQAFLTLVDEMEARFEERKGAAAMAAAGATDALESTGGIDDSQLTSTQRAARAEADAILHDAQALAKERGDESANMSKRALWDVVNQDTWDDPFLQVHQMRLDARATYTDLYAHSSPEHLRAGRGKHRRAQPMQPTTRGPERGHRDRENNIMQNPMREYQAFGWGMGNQEVVDFTMDRNLTFAQGDNAPHVKDPKTGAADLRFEKKGGRGLRWTGPRYYKLGIDEDRAKADHPSERPAL